MQVAFIALNSATSPSNITEIIDDRGDTLPGSDYFNGARGIAISANGMVCVSGFLSYNVFLIGEVASVPTLNPFGIMILCNLLGFTSYRRLCRPDWELYRP